MPAPNRKPEQPTLNAAMGSSRAARKISYASSAATGAGRALVRVLENATGRLGLIARGEGYEREIARGRDFWQVLMDRYGREVIGGSLTNIPAEGPLILIANHPFGILDGLMMGHILCQARGDFRILANSVFRKAAEIDRIVLPVSCEAGKAAQAANLETRRIALGYLARCGAIGVFPGGTVSTSARPFGLAIDPFRRGFTARMIAKSGAAVVPVYFAGQNSRAFHLASHLHLTLRLGLLIREFRARVDAPVRVAVGRPVDPARLAELHAEPRRMMDFLRRATYELSPEPLRSYDHGYEFEAKCGA